MARENHNMKYLILIAFYSAFVAVAQQPNLRSNSKITTIGYWNNEAKCTYHVTSSEIKYKANSDKIAKESSESYDLDLRIVDSTEHTYIFEAKYSHEDYKASDSELEKILNSLSTESTIRYQTDEFGSFDTILNLEELKMELIEKLNKSKELIGDVKDPDMAKLYAMTIDTFISNYTNLEDVEALFLTDIITIHSIYGLELTLAKPIELDMWFPTIGEVSLTGTGKLTLMAVNKAADQATISLNAKPNQEELKAYMTSFILMFMMEKTKKIDFKVAKVNMTNKMKYKLRLSDGWMIEIESSQIATITDGKDKVKKVSKVVYAMM